MEGDDPIRLAALTLTTLTLLILALPSPGASKAGRVEAAGKSRATLGAAVRPRTVRRALIRTRTHPKPPGVLSAQEIDRLTPTQLRAYVYRTDPSLAHIIDHEDGRWDPTISYGGGHNPYNSYGLCQAAPGTKMRSAGANWQTSAATQLLWCRAYSDRYGGTAAAWSAWQRQGWW